MVSTRPPTSKCSSPFNKPLVTVPKTLIRNGIIVTFRIHIFSIPSKIEVLLLFSLSFSFLLWSAGTAKSTILQVLLFFVFCFLLYGLVFWLRFDELFVCQSSIGVGGDHSVTHVLGCTYTIWSCCQISISCT